MLRLGNLSKASAISFCLAISVSFGTAQLYGQKPGLVVPAQAPTGLEKPAQRSLPLQVYNMPPEMVGTVGATLRIKYASQPNVNITIEPGTDRLMVQAPEAIQREISETIRSVNAEAGLKVSASGGAAPAPVETQRIYQLRHAKSDQFESSLSAAGGRKLSEYQTTQGIIVDYRLDVSGESAGEIRVDRRNNSVLIQGSSKDVSAWQLVVSAIDNSYERGARPTQLVQLDRAKPENVQRAIKLVKLVSFQDDSTDDSGIVQTDENGMPLDAQEPAVGIVDPETQESGLFGDVDIAFVPDLGLAIVKGSKRDVQRVLEVIEQIKKQSDATQPVINVVPLKHVDSLALATVLTTLYDQNFAQRQGTVSITGLGQPNAILLIGREEAMAAILDLVKKLDQPLDPSSQLKVFKLIHTSALQMQTTVRDFFVERAPTANTPRPGLGVRVSVVADYRTNALIVQAGPRDLLEVAKLIDELDVASTQTEIEMRVFPLRNALSDDLAPILQDAINGPTDAAGEGQVQAPNGKLSIIDRAVGGDDRRLNGGILAGVLVTSNPSINALLIRAPARSMELIEVLIKQLDQPPSLESQIKVFPIESNDATSLAQIIQQLFGIPVTAGVATGGIGAAFNQNTAQQGTGNDILVPLRVSVDTRSNSIIVSGSRGDLEVVEVLIWRLDEQGVQTRKTEVVWLRNSNATDVADAITQFLTTQRQTIQQQLLQGNAISIFEQIDREVIVVAEPTTNSLIISATPRFYEQIMAVIERLDRRPPLIMVQMLMAEVSLDDTFELGAELGLQDSLIFDRNVATGGTLSSPAFNLTNPLNAATTAGQPQNVAGQGFSGFGLGRTNSALGYGGLVLSAASESVNVLVRALQDANRLQILSRPQVMTLDTIEAYVLVGQRVPRVQGVSGGSTVSPPVITTADTEVGLIMRIQPRTNQDGLIILDVQIERSSLGPESTGIPVGFSANGDVIRSPIINTTRAQTRISAYDGQTVVFAGLIQKTRSSRSRRIPWLADIPIAGHLFKFESEQESRTELLVILTPRIIHGESDVEMINQLETARMSWCLADVVNINGVTNLSSGNGLWGPPCSAVIYPDVNPTIEYLDGVEVQGMQLNESVAPVAPVEVPPTPQAPTEPSQSVADPLLPQAYMQQGQPNGQTINTVQPASYQNQSNVYIQR